MLSAAIKIITLNFKLIFFVFKFILFTPNLEYGIQISSQEKEALLALLALLALYGQMKYRFFAFDRSKKKNFFDASVARKIKSSLTVLM